MSLCVGTLGQLQKSRGASLEFLAIVPKKPLNSVTISFAGPIGCPNEFRTINTRSSLVRA